MTHDFSALKVKIQETKDWLSNEYLGIRTGRATPTLLDSIRVESYGSKMPINQLASVNIEDARTLRISPWDASQVQAIEQAIAKADLGVSASVDEKGLRVSFPELTAERRGMLQKIVKDKLEHARISMRGARDEAWSDIQKNEKDKEISEDEKFRYKDEMQKLINEGNTALDDIAKRKEEEILN
jgi:ribosome recycling factor